VGGPTQVKKSLLREAVRPSGLFAPDLLERAGRTFAHDVFFRECIARVSRLNFLYALGLGI
jgi:hypothetical protein